MLNQKNDYVVKRFQFSRAEFLLRLLSTSSTLTLIGICYLILTMHQFQISSIHGNSAHINCTPAGTRQPFLVKLFICIVTLKFLKILANNSHYISREGSAKSLSRKKSFWRLLVKKVKNLFLRNFYTIILHLIAFKTILSSN